MSPALALLGGWRGLALTVLAAALLSAAVWRAGQVRALRAELAAAAAQVAALEIDLAAADRRARNMEIRDHAHTLAEERLAPIEPPNISQADQASGDPPAGDNRAPAAVDRAAQRLRDLCAADPNCRR